jgi:hypothetical protein
MPGEAGKGEMSVPVTFSSADHRNEKEKSGTGKIILISQREV